MDDNKVISSAEFFCELKKNHDQRYAFLLGNGINYYLKNRARSWNDLLHEFVQKEFAGGDSILKSEDVTNTEVVNFLEIMRVNDRGAKQYKSAEELRNELMRFLKEKLESRGPVQSKMLDSAWQKHHILTTNFDDEIETYIASLIKKRLRHCRAQKKIGSEESGGSRYYKWNSFWGLKDCPADKDPLDQSNDVWHVHGKFDGKTSQSVLFSLTRYVNAIKKVEQWDIASKEGWAGRNTWVNIFYNSPLIIAGLGLTNQEVFLRTLLIERKRHWLKISAQKKEPQSYYLVRRTANDKAETNGRVFLRALGFKVVEFDDFEEMYNSVNWK